MGECRQGTVAFRLLLFVLGSAGGTHNQIATGLSKWIKKEPHKITTAQKPQIIQSVDKNLNMKLSDIEQMMKTLSSTLNTILEKRKTRISFQ
ncbi:hypothetical protein T4B_9490 [Trichinella pseudospiralis]|uniref:Uncharacterized protein n=1 Tax=Trichinella pseudospiralis TaxID=6337 RepID=A0A0V1IP32_TRIPS|nr:hypothetical protein T4B_9490 [Trichinella pseudospiralis]